MGINRPSLYAAFGKQGAVVPQRARALPDGSHVVPVGGPAQADRQGGGRGNFLGLRQDGAATGNKARGCMVVSGTRVRQRGGDGSAASRPN